MNIPNKFTMPLIKQPSREIYLTAQQYIDSLAKPPQSLGELETIAARLCSIYGKTQFDIKKRCIIVLASDNGVIDEGVSYAPQSVTTAQAINIADGLTGVSVLAKQFSTDIIVADVGINANISHPKIINCKIRKSTSNIAKSPAMTRQEAEKAIETGIALAKHAKEQGYTAIGVGEMGICNTTTSSAVLACLLNLSNSDIVTVVGKGSGLRNDTYLHKIEVIKTAISINTPNSNDPIDVLQKVGGFDLAAMTGVFIGAAHLQLPVVIDGFISVVAALCAVRLNETVLEYLFASHNSAEPGYSIAIKSLGLTPYLNLQMRLGEGSGCPLMFAVMDASIAVLNNMATFEQAKINDDYLLELTKA